MYRVYRKSRRMHAVEFIIIDFRCSSNLINGRVAKWHCSILRSFGRLVGFELPTKLSPEPTDAELLNVRNKLKPTSYEYPFHDSQSLRRTKRSPSPRRSSIGNAAGLDGKILITRIHQGGPQER